MKLLTQEEVNALPDGTNVYVQWSGWGDVSARYTVIRSEFIDDEVYASLPQDFGPYYGRPLKFVGTESYHCKVWVDSEG